MLAWPRVAAPPLYHVIFQHLHVGHHCITSSIGLNICMLVIGTALRFIALQRIASTRPQRFNSRLQQPVAADINYPHTPGLGMHWLRTVQYERAKLHQQQQSTSITIRLPCQLLKRSGHMRVCWKGTGRRHKKTGGRLQNRLKVSCRLQCIARVNISLLHRLLQACARLEAALHCACAP
jgi:hypothetical protein